MFQNIQNRRIKYILYISLLIFILIIIKVFYIQVIEYKKLNKLANELWSRNLTVKADRGRILDRNGKVLVDNVGVNTLVFNKMNQIYLFVYIIILH